jgi:hypothetical protein
VRQARSQPADFLELRIALRMGIDDAQESAATTEEIVRHIA